MGLSLEEYAKLHPMPEPAERETMAAAVRTWAERQEEREQAEQLKRSILEQLQSGNDPQLILYAAIKCIGLYSADAEFTEQAQGCLDSVYSDLMQQSLLTDNAAIAAERLAAMQSEYNAKLRRSINRQLAGYRRITAALNEALAEINDLDPQEDTAE